jgi:hypothetical protein
VQLKEAKSQLEDSRRTHENMVASMQSRGNPEAMNDELKQRIDEMKKLH